ncbi:MAG TPA: toll/interleukin-1 receptor domain-containing protein, partial [Methylomirabilota bacterium]|nr:toll/interleukin-1 receptor domain-containing protein [Methylomirabilota bacterium]
MGIWKDINKDSWSFASDVVSGYGGGIGRYQISYAINIEKGISLNGRISANLKIDESPLKGVGLVCRADEQWTFLAMYVATIKTETPATSLMLGVCKEGSFNVIASQEEEIVLGTDFNHFSLKFLSGNIRGEIRTSQKSYALECSAPHIPFPGYMGLLKFYGCGVTAKNIEIEKVSYSNLASGEERMKKYLYDVFISYSSKDQPIIERLAQDLKAAGISYWVDSEQITFGDSITGKIEEGLRES